MRLFVREDAIWIVVDAGQARAGRDRRWRATRSWTTSRRRRGPTSRSRRCWARPRRARLAAIGVDAGGRSAAAPLFAHAPGRRGAGESGRPHARARQRRFLAGRPRRAVLAAVHARLAAAGVARAGAGGGRGGAHRRRRAALRRRDHRRTISRWRSAWTTRSTTPRGAISVRSRSSASATAATSTGGSSAWTSTGPAIPPRGMRIESDAKPKAGRVTSAGRLPDGRGVALAMLHTSIAWARPSASTARSAAPQWCRDQHPTSARRSASRHGRADLALSRPASAPKRWRQRGSASRTSSRRGGSGGLDDSGGRQAHQPPWPGPRAGRAG